MTSLALGIVSASIPLAILVAVASHRTTAGIAVMLELWVAAGLLHLSQSASWPAIISAASLIGIRKLVVSALHVRALVLPGGIAPPRRDSDSRGTIYVRKRW